MFAIAFDMANLFAAIYALKKIAWFKASVRDIRAFKVENWSDFTREGGRLISHGDGRGDRF